MSFVHRIRALAAIHWPTVFREFWIDRHAEAGSLRLTVWDWRRPARHDPDRLVALTAEALARLSAAGQGFGELVTSHLKIVVATEVAGRHVLIAPRAYASTFDGSDGDDPHFLAARLVWTATAVRLGHDARAAGRKLNEAGTRAACWEAQRRFVSQFADAERWIAYLEPVRRPDRPDPAA